MNLKRIALDHLYNCRDLGGYMCDGGATAYHKLLRADSPSALTGEEWQILYDYGVRTVIDLRSPNEVSHTPYEVPEGMELIRYPLQQLSDMMKEEAKEEYTKEEKENAAAVSFGKSLTTGYERIMEEGPERIATVLNYIVEKLEKGAVLFHCTAGKDRTGITAALIYLICGVSDVDIIADYQVTETYQIKNRVFDVMPTYLKPLLNSNAENMKKFLQAAEERNYLGLLRENGLEESAVTSIREHMIEN